MQLLRSLVSYGNPYATRLVYISENRMNEPNQTNKKNRVSALIMSSKEQTETLRRRKVGKAKKKKGD